MSDKIFISSVKEFFESVIPSFAGAEGLDAAKGTIKFELEGAGGGVWRVRFPALEVQSGDGPSETQWKGLAQDFLSYMNGQVARYELADQNRAFEWSGDRQLMAAFGQILTPRRHSRGPRPLG